MYAGPDRRAGADRRGAARTRSTRTRSSCSRRSRPAAGSASGSSAHGQASSSTPCRLPLRASVPVAIARRRDAELVEASPGTRPLSRHEPPRMTERTMRLSSLPTSSGARRPPRTRSRAPRPRTAAASPSGTASARRPERCETATAAPSPATSTTAIRSDIALMRELGLDAFRFSIAWPRDPADGPRAASTRRGSTSTTGSSTRCSRAASSRS